MNKVKNEAGYREPAPCIRCRQIYEKSVQVHNRNAELIRENSVLLTKVEMLKPTPIKKFMQQHHGRVTFFAMILFYVCLVWINVFIFGTINPGASVGTGVILTDIIVGLSSFLFFVGIIIDAVERGKW